MKFLVRKKVYYFFILVKEWNFILVFIKLILLILKCIFFVYEIKLFIIIIDINFLSLLLLVCRWLVLGVGGLSSLYVWLGSRGY